MAASDLTLFWAAVIAFSILVYVVLDGFDLGVGVLFGFASGDDEREAMIAAIAPFWDGNETWLVVVGASLFAAFPMAYAVFLPAFYLPVLLLLLGLIFRGVAFEFRSHSGRGRRWWDRGFFLGSAAAAFVQGAAIGAMIEGVHVVGGQFAGGPFDWLAPFPALCGVGLVLGYCLLGASWLALKSEGPVRERAHRRIPWLAAGAAAALAVASLVAADARGHFEILLRERWWGGLSAAAGAVALAGAVVGAWRRSDALPFAMSAAFFLASFVTLAALFWPYMIPYSVTVAAAAAPEASLRFLFWGALVVLPVILLYTIGVYWIFRGKAGRGYS